VLRGFFGAGLCISTMQLPVRTRRVRLACLTPTAAFGWGIGVSLILPVHASNKTNCSATAKFQNSPLSKSYHKSLATLLVAGKTKTIPGTVRDELRAFLCLPACPSTRVVLRPLTGLVCALSQAQAYVLLMASITP
jgi:hypothetical protein